MILVTGGAGFIGSNFILQWFGETTEQLVNLDLLTYSGNLKNLSSLQSQKNYQFIQGDICDADLISRLLKEYKPRAIMHFAAESHVDRSIYSPDVFLKTNIWGTFNLLKQSLAYYESQNKPKDFRFLHVSTDEVYGSLEENSATLFTEDTAYQPNSPYSASKASSDHFVRAFFHTYGLPVLTSNCSNNYGPFQFPEKLIPLMISNALEGKNLPIYGDGLNRRDWLYVEDHCRALKLVMEKGTPGQVYNIGGDSEKTNLDVVGTLIDILDRKRPRTDGKSYKEQIQYVKDRPGHDRRYAIDFKKIHQELNWKPSVSFMQGMEKTVDWYLEHTQWINEIKNGSYKEWVQVQYGEN